MTFTVVVNKALFGYVMTVLIMSCSGGSEHDKDSHDLSIGEAKFRFTFQLFFFSLLHTEIGRYFCLINPLNMKKFLIIGLVVSFVLFFNIGYLFHDLIFGAWFHQKIGHIAREEYIIPLIALGYFLYCLIQTFLFPIFYEYSSRHWDYSPAKSGLLFGLLLGFTWDALEGGLIEYATLSIPFESFLLDSSYHTIEGGAIGLLLSVIYRKVIH